MSYDNALVAGKLRRWERFLNDYELPSWNEIPDIGLYMEQVTELLKQYLDYLPPELKDEEIITASAINNYVRRHIMPEPYKKRYYRRHLAYLLMICSLKSCLSISDISKITPVDLSDEELKETYTQYARLHKTSSELFIESVRFIGARILDRDPNELYSVDDTEGLIISTALISGLGRLMSSKLLNLKGLDLENGGSIEIREK